MFYVHAGDNTMELTVGLENKVALAPYAEAAKLKLRVLMTERQMTYDDLVAKLEEQGVQLTSSNLRNKVAHGALPASLYLMLLELLQSTEHTLPRR